MCDVAYKLVSIVVSIMIVFPFLKYSSERQNVHIERAREGRTSSEQELSRTSISAVMRDQCKARRQSTNELLLQFAVIVVANCIALGSRSSIVQQVRRRDVGGALFGALA